MIGAAGLGATSLAARLPAGIESIRHRGPDEIGSYASPDGTFFVGHARLAILGVGPAGRQPMDDGDGRLLAFNGEIYNHQTRRRDLGVAYEWAGSSDTETLLAVLSRQGIRGLDSCEGMFAGAYFDRDRDELVLFRDTLGIKPLFMRIESDGTVVFGSEINAIQSLVGPGACAVDGQSLRALLRYQNLPPGRSLFSGIRPLKPGEIVRIRGVSGRRPSIRSEWIGRPADGRGDAVDADPGLVRGLVERAVDSHLLSERPVGTYLSGGIDSTIIAGLAARAGSVVEAFTGFFDPGSPADDERELARITARRFGLNLHEVAIRPDDLVDRLDDLVGHLGEPRMGPGTIAQFVVAEAASAHVQVVLAGHGGDELFGGYPIHQSAIGIDQRRPLSAVRRTSGRRRAVTMWALLRHWRTGRLPFAPILFDLEANDSVKGLFESDPDPAMLMASVDRYYRSVYLPGLLEAEDRISMAFGMETRLPLWTQSVVEEIFRMESIPRFGDRPKGLLRDAFDDLLPTEVKRAPKRGFPTPFASWFRGPCRDFVRDRLEAWPSVFEDTIPADVVRRIVAGHLTRPLPGPFDERRANRIWILLQLASWARIFEPTEVVDAVPRGGTP